jgi:hypothetical protein
LDIRRAILSRQLLDSLTEEINVLSGNSEFRNHFTKPRDRCFVGASLMSFGCVQPRGRDNLFPVLHLIMPCEVFQNIVGRIHGKQWWGGVVPPCLDYAFATVDSSIKLSELAIDDRL